MDISVIKLKGVVSSLINWVRADITANVAAPQNSWLYREFGQIDIDGRNFYLELRDMLMLGDEDARKLLITLMFDRKRKELPTIHINYPSENNGQDNTINTGFSEEFIDAENVVRSIYSRSVLGQYELIFTGTNSIQILMMYEFMYGLLIASADTLAYHFDKFEFAGRQLMVNNEDQLPNPVFYRSINITLQAKKKVSSIIERRSASNVVFNGRWYIEYDIPEFEIVSHIPSELLSKFEILWVGQIDGSKLLSTVAGSHIDVNDKDFSSSYIPGSTQATFQLQDVQRFKAADTDNLWFDEAGLVRQVPLSELVDFDYQSTVVKYSNSAPYNVSWIGLLRADEVLTQQQIDQLHFYFSLNIMWSGFYNDFGSLKDNRSIV